MKIMLSLALCFFIIIARCQDPVKWTFGSKKVSDLGFEIRFTAQIQEGWHIYSQTTPEGGPYPTKIEFAKNPLIITEGKTREEGELELYFEKVFDVEVHAYSNQVTFLQHVKIKSAIKTNLSGTIEYMACDNQRCTAPKKIPFQVRLD